MSSIIEGYNYDIFISYRQKDNKHDGWVTKFVENLKGELESTFKEDISIYFDENPHDRLQETHNVDKSLEGKLKCLIFLPILSRTYCDTESYAWQNELLSFIKIAESDKFGKDVRLRNGNVASRILPVRIHDLEPEDVKLFEKETGSVLRALDFVFKTSTGVNRTLKWNEDHPNDNLDKTFYSDQINKVALAIKEIILGLKAEISRPLADKVTPVENLIVPETETSLGPEVRPFKFTKRNVLSGIAGITFIAILTILAFSGIFHKAGNRVIKDRDGKISIAVTVFDNNTNDTTLNWLAKGIPELIRNNLTGSEELAVQNSQTMYELYGSLRQTHSASLAPSLSREAAIKLKTGTYITGSFQKFGNNILTYVKLIDTNSDELLWTGSVEGNLERYKYLADSLSAQLKSFLEMKGIKQKTSKEYGDVSAKSPEALRRYVEGMEMLIKGNFKSATQNFEESFALDTTFTLCALYASIVYSYESDFLSSAKWENIAYRGKKRLPYYYQLWLESCKACMITKNCDSILYYNDLLAQSDIKSRFFWLDIGYMYLALEQNQKAVKAFEKAETISSEWGGEWKFKKYYYYFGTAYHRAGNHELEARVYLTGLRLFPDDMGIFYQQAVCSLTTGDTLKSAEFINRLIKMAKDQKVTSSDLETGYGDLCAEANLSDRAEEHYRFALKSDPDNYSKINKLALVLIKNDRDVNEAADLTRRSLQIKPGNSNALYVQGMVSFKQGKYREALDILEQACSNHLTYYPELFYDTKKVRAAFAGQRNRLLQKNMKLQ
jgi:tetratricopeptide (TPR) repeat protein